MPIIYYRMDYIRRIFVHVVHIEIHDIIGLPHLIPKGVNIYRRRISQGRE